MQMDDGARGWLLRIARKSFWRVHGVLDLDDLISEGFVCYYDVVRRYPHVTERRHLMRLFQVKYLNRITDLAKKRTRHLGVLEELAFETEPFEEPSTFTDAPEPVKTILRLLLSEDGVKGLQQTYQRFANGYRETLNDRLCKLIGLDSTQLDLAGMVRNYLRTR